MVTMTFCEPTQATAMQTRYRGNTHMIRFGEKSIINIGRDPGNDVIPMHQWFPVTMPKLNA